MWILIGHLIVFGAKLIAIFFKQNYIIGSVNYRIITCQLFRGCHNLLLWLIIHCRYETLFKSWLCRFLKSVSSHHIFTLFIKSIVVSLLIWFRLRTFLWLWSIFETLRTLSFLFDQQIVQILIGGRKGSGVARLIPKSTRRCLILIWTWQLLLRWRQITVFVSFVGQLSLLHLRHIVFVSFRRGGCTSIHAMFRSFSVLEIGRNFFTITRLSLYLLRMILSSYSCLWSFRHILSCRSLMSENWGNKLGLLLCLLILLLMLITC